MQEMFNYKEHTYFIFDQFTDECVGEVTAMNVLDAEYIAAGKFLDHGLMYALSADSF